jgi:hypothetical protein
MENSVIVECDLQMPKGMKQRWVISEVSYRSDKNNISYGKPDVLSVTEENIRESLSVLLAGLLKSKGKYFNQVTRAILKDEKRRKRKGGNAT